VSKSDYEIKTIGVIGAGQMGRGIAHVASLAGYEVKVFDISEDQLKEAISGIDKNMARQVSKERITAEAKDVAIDRIKTSTALDIMADVDLVIEAATEKEDVKRKIFAPTHLQFQLHALALVQIAPSVSWAYTS